MANIQGNNQFLIAFQASLDKLNTLNNAITQNNRNRDSFSGFVLGRLQYIRGKIEELVGKIRDIRNQLNALEGQVNNNTGDIQNKNDEISNLQSQIQQLTQEKNQLNGQVTDANKLAAEKQNQIDQYEAQIRDLTAQQANLNAQLANLTTERDTIQNELASKGDIAAQHAAEIKRLTDENAANLQKQTQENQVQLQNAQAQINQLQQEQQTNTQRIQELEQQLTVRTQQIQELQQQIAQRDDRIKELEQQIAQKDAEIAGHQNNANNSQAQQQQNAADIASANMTITKLLDQIKDLQAQNTDLIERIKAATNAINEATQHLEELADPNFYQQSEGSVNQVVAEIEALLEQISRSIQGQQPQGGPGGLPLPGISRNPNHSNPRQRSIIITINGYQTSVGDLLQNLRHKSSQIRNDPLNNKYIKAYNDIDWNLASSPPDVETMVKAVLNGYGVVITNTGILKGGNTRKYKKYLYKQKNKSKRTQYGGFLYGKNKSTSSVSTQPTSSLSSSTNSGYSKKQNTFKKVKKNRARGVSKRSKR